MKRIASLITRLSARYQQELRSAALITCEPCQLQLQQSTACLQQAARSTICQSCGHAAFVSQFHTTAVSLYAKKGKGKQTKPPTAVEAGPADELVFDTDPYEHMMVQSVHHFQQELGRIHSGRASPGLLEPIEVTGAVNQQRAVPLRQLATVTARGSSLLVINAFNPQDQAAIIKSLQDSPLKLEARIEGKEVHVPMPRPTVEKINGMVKLVAAEAEKGKLSVRSARQKAVEAAKKALTSKDDKERAQKEIQAITERYIEQLDALKAAKDKELHELR